MASLLAVLVCWLLAFAVTCGGARGWYGGKPGHLDTLGDWFMLGVALGLVVFSPIAAWGLS